MANKAVCDTGPIIHLHEINLLNALSLFSPVYIAEEVKNELKRNNTPIPTRIKIKNLTPKFKDVSSILATRFSLDLGESESIALALQEKAVYLLTDDLDARTTAYAHNIEAHGTAGIILRALREKIINKETAISKVKALYAESSLFITRELINQIIIAINEFKK